MQCIAITGGIGSGKSTLCRMLEREGTPVFYCDTEARALMQSDESLRRQIEMLVGSLEREDIRRFLADGPHQAERLNSLVWPRVAQEWKTFCQRYEERDVPVVVMECALLFESGFEDLADISILVTAPTVLRRQRVSQRDGLSAEKIDSIMALQMPEEEKCRRATHILNNIGTPEELLDAYHRLQR